jgi:protein O-mannosyl-transferase
MWFASVLAATLLAFWPLFQNGFVNYDDPFTLQQNEHLAAPGMLKWAFTTTHMGHYQPLAWVAWSQAKTLFGMTATAFHTVSLLGHVANAALVYLLAIGLTALAGFQTRSQRFAAVVASTAFAIHPMRVEVVAWASAFPYILSLGWLLLATLAYIRYCTGAAGARALSEPGKSRRVEGWLGVSICCFVFSLLSRATAIGFPIVLLALDVYPLARLRRGPPSLTIYGKLRRTGVALLTEKIPFFMAALVAVAVESASREITSVQEVGLGARLTMAASAPFVYLGRTLLPIGRSPIEARPIAPALEWIPLVLGLAGIALISTVASKFRHRWPAFAVGWLAFLVLLAPVIGLTPTGQQVIADRYMYIPGVVLSLIAGGLVARVACADRLQLEPVLKPAVVTIAAMLSIASVLSVSTWRQTGWWHDSITLWTRAADLDPQNDIATYNLAIALAEAGRDDEAAQRYQQTLHLVPDHSLARRNLTLINDARGARGIARTRGGQYAEALQDLRAALETRPDDPAIINALAFALVQTGRWSEAAAVLKQAIAHRPQDDEIAHNLARVLATAPDPAVRNGAMALRLALAVRDRTGGRDPRVLDTLAAAYALTGESELAVKTASEAAALARQLGDFEMARDIDARARNFTTRPASRQ